MPDEKMDERLRAVLGPDGPELTCEACFEHIDKFAELELAGRDAESEVRGMRAHLDGCPACAEDYESLIALIASQPPT
jgi:hypothetical protein